MSVSMRMRFRVLERDVFTCRYCGRRAPDVQLEVDHVNPRANDGRDDIGNLVTACYDCNRGKSDLAPKGTQLVLHRDGYGVREDSRQEREPLKLDWAKANEWVSGFLRDKSAEWREGKKGFIAALTLSVAVRSAQFEGEGTTSGRQGNSRTDTT